MEASQRPKDTSKAREKERKREEKELKRLAAASGIKLGAVPATIPPAMTPVPASTAEAGTTGGWAGFKKKDGGFKSSGWATVSPASNNPEPPNSTKSGWSRVGHPPQPSGGGWNSVQSQISEAAGPPPPPPTSLPPQPPPPSVNARHLAPSFQRSGFTNLDTTTPSPTLEASLASSVATSTTSSSGGWASVSTPSLGTHAQPPTFAPPPPPSPPTTSGWSSMSANPRPQGSWSRVGAVPAPAPPPPSPLSPPPPPPSDDGYRDLGRPPSPSGDGNYDRRSWQESILYNGPYLTPPSPRQNEMRRHYYDNDARDMTNTERYPSSRRYEDRGRGLERNRDRRW